MDKNNGSRRFIDVLPLDFAMELAEDMDAMDAFSRMEPSCQKECIDRVRRLDSKEEVRVYVRRLKYL